MDTTETRNLWKVYVRRPRTASKRVHLVEHLGMGVTAETTLCGLRFDWRGMIVHNDWRVTCPTCARTHV